MKDKLLKIINHYGIEHQQRKLEEEVFELQEAIIKRTYLPEEVDDDYFAMSMEIEQAQEHIAEEIADVFVLLHQIRFYYDLDDVEVARIFTEKIDRQLERIENE